MLCVESEFLEFFDESLHFLQTPFDWQMLTLATAHLLIWPSHLTRNPNQRRMVTAITNKWRYLIE